VSSIFTFWLAWSALGLVAFAFGVLTAQPDPNDP
jgi:hypothetical protein